MPSFILTMGIIVNVALINVGHLFWDLISFFLTDADEGESNAGQILSQKVEHHQQKERPKLINTGLEPAKEGDKYFDFQYHTREPSIRSLDRCCPAHSRNKQWIRGSTPKMWTNKTDFNGTCNSIQVAFRRSKFHLKEGIKTLFHLHLLTDQTIYFSLCSKCTSRNQVRYNRWTSARPVCDLMY